MIYSPWIGIIPERNQPLKSIARLGKVANSISDDSLLDHARNGDQNAFRQLLERHHQSVSLTVSGMLGAGPEIDDVVQEVFIRFYRTMGRFRGDASCKTYLTRIAINTSLDALRRRKRMRSRFISRDDPMVNLPDPSTDISQSERFDRANLINLAMNQLKPHHRSVVVLRLVDGYSTSDTAEILGIAQGTVLSRLSRAITRLRDILGPILEQEIR